MTFDIQNGVLLKVHDCDAHVTIPNSVTTIGADAFKNCTNLQSICIPNSVTSIKYRAFFKCVNLRSIFLPDSVTSIGGYAFCNCSNLQSIHIPDSVTSIGGYAFRRCSALQSIVLPDSVRLLGEHTFDGCQNLQFVNIPSSTIRIGNWTFSGCKNLQSIIIPSSVAFIGEFAFFRCTNLRSIRIPDSITFIASFTFSNCTNLRSITLPDSIRHIYRNAFSECHNLRSVILSPNHPHFFVKNGMIISRNGTLVSTYGSIIDAIIPDSVISIRKAAFHNCINLRSITIPDSVLAIEHDTFNNCPNLRFISISPNHPCYVFENGMLISRDGVLIFTLENITHAIIPNSTNSIAENAFGFHSALQILSIPDSVTAISERAFCTCSNVQSVQLAPHHFDINIYPPNSSTVLLYNTPLSFILEATPIIICIASINDVPEKYRLKACIGFAQNSEKYPEKFYEGYLNYIRHHGIELIKSSINHPQILHSLCSKHLLDAATLPILLEETIRIKSAELTAMLLAYQHTHLKHTTEYQDDDWTLD